MNIKQSSIGAKNGAELSARSTAKDKQVKTDRLDKNLKLFPGNNGLDTTSGGPDSNPGLNLKA